MLARVGYLWNICGAFVEQTQGSYKCVNVF